MYKKVKQYIESNHMIQKGDFVIAGVSGGSDSVALLYLLQKYREEQEFELQVVHIHHGIRGKEADRDRDFVENICHRLGIAVTVRYYDVPGLSREWKKGEEETGRIVRKKAFEEAIDQSGYPENVCRIAIAHNQNDLAETLLHNLARGTGLRGLCSMKPVSERIIRPILCLTKTEIEAYLKQCGGESIFDSSNQSEQYTRNRLRKHILPYMEKEINSQAVAHMAELSKIAEMAEEYLVEKGKELLEGCRTEKGFHFTERFFEKKRILKTYALQEAMEALAGKRKDISAIHIQKILELEERTTGKEVQLPYQIIARRTYEGILLSKAVTKKTKEQTAEYMLLPDGKLKCEMGVFEANIFLNKQYKIEEKACTKWFDYDKINGNLCVRIRKTGDYMIVNQEGNRKKLNRILIDEKIPKEERDHIPVIAMGNEILWIAGSRMSERYKITAGTKKILELRYQGGKTNE